MGGGNDQIGRCCFCFGRRNFRPGHVARAASSTGRHDHASRPSPRSAPSPTVVRLHSRSGTSVWLSTMRGTWHLHVANATAVPPPGPPQDLRIPIRLRYRTEPGGHNKGQGSNKVCPVRYAWSYDVPSDNVQFSPKPYDCDWGTAPIGAKHCSYVPVVSAYNAARNVVWRDDKPTSAGDLTYKNGKLVVSHGDVTLCGSWMDEGGGLSEATTACA